MWHAADGHPVRRIDWDAEGEPQGSLLFFPGRGDHYEKYLETLDHWASRGWRVTASDWRGQAGSGRLGYDSVTGHVDDFSIWVADLAHLWQLWVRETPGPHVLVGHSMGGHLALRGVAEGLVRPEALILSAPMLGLLPSFVPTALMHGIARVMARLGDPRRPAWKWSEMPGEVPAGRQHLLTADPDRYADEIWWRGHRPMLVMGPGSWGWVEAAYASIRSLLTPGRLEAVDIPVLVIATDADRLVNFSAIRRAVARLPKAELIRFGKEARHEILREADPVRNRALAAIDDFLGRVAAGAEAPAS